MYATKCPGTPWAYERDVTQFFTFAARAGQGDLERLTLVSCAGSWPRCTPTA